MEAIIWLGVMIAFAVGEAVTVGLTSIWFAVGALGALITAGLGLGFWPQITVFIVLSGITLALVRPLAKKLLRPTRPPMPTGSLERWAWSPRR